MSHRVLLAVATAALLAGASPAAANEARPGPVLSHEGVDALEDKLGMIGLIGLLGLLGLRRRDRRH